MAHYFTSGQVARQLRVSISTLKRWLDGTDVRIPEIRNGNGWRLFSAEDLEILKEFNRDLRKNGKRFNNTTLLPVSVDHSEEKYNG